VIGSGSFSLDLSFNGCSAYDRSTSVAREVRIRKRQCHFCRLRNEARRKEILTDQERVRRRDETYVKVKDRWTAAFPKRRAIGIITAFKRAEILEGTGLESFRLLERKGVDSRTRRNTHSQEKPMKSLNQLAEINRFAHILEESGQ